MGSLNGTYLGGWDQISSKWMVILRDLPKIIRAACLGW